MVPTRGSAPEGPRSELSPYGFLRISGIPLTQHYTSVTLYLAGGYIRLSAGLPAGSIAIACQCPGWGCEPNRASFACRLGPARRTLPKPAPSLEQPLDAG